MRKNEQRQPAFPQQLTGSGITQEHIELCVIEVGQAPGICPMSSKGLFRFPVVILERVGGAGSLSRDCLVISRFVTLNFCVKGALRSRRNLLLLAPLEIFSVGSTPGLSRHRIVVRFENLFDEGTGFWCQPTGASAVVIPGKKTKETTPVAHFCFTIPLLPAKSRSFGDGGTLCSTLRLLLIFILFWVDNPVAKNGRREIDITSLFE